MAVSLVVSLASRRAHGPIVPLRTEGEYLPKFASVGSVRELPNGQVLVADPRDQGLVVVDFGQHEQHGVRGLGSMRSGELRSLGGDSTLFADDIEHRWAVLHGTHLTESNADSEVARSVTDVIGTDDHGHALVDISGTPRAVTYTALGDSNQVLLIGLHSGRIEGTVTLWQMRRPSRLRPIPAYGETERALMAPDGSIAVIRLHPFRIDWRSPDGAWTRGQPIPVVQAPVTDAERQAVTATRGGGHGNRLLPAIDWPETVPPVATPGPASAMLMNGDLAVGRTVTATAPGHRYDIIDRSGTRTSELALPDSERIVGSGQHSLYVACRQRDGKERLQRRPWP